MKDQNALNKSLQLSPRGPLGSVHAFQNSMQCWADAAVQLSSMLGCFTSEKCI